MYWDIILYYYKYIILYYTASRKHIVSILMPLLEIYVYYIIPYYYNIHYIILGDTLVEIHYVDYQLVYSTIRNPHCIHIDTAELLGIHCIILYSSRNTLYYIMLY